MIQKLVSIKKITYKLIFCEEKKLYETKKKKHVKRKIYAKPKKKLFVKLFNL